MTHRPDSDMCRACRHCFTRSCMHLHFDKMKAVKVYSDGTKEVLCSDYARAASSNNGGIGIHSSGRWSHIGYRRGKPLLRYITTRP